MAGANQIPKFLPVDRELRISPLRTVGTEFHTRIPVTITASPLTAAQFTLDQIYTAATPNFLVGPSATDLCSYFQSSAPPTNQGLSTVEVGTRFEIIIENQDLVNSKFINFGAGVGPALTVPPNMIQKVAYELDTINPQNWTRIMQQPLSTTTGGAAGVTSFEGRMGAVVSAAGDYTASEITFVPFGIISSVNVQNAIQELTNEKVTLRNFAGTVGTGAVAAQDILVAIAAGDNYVPSQLLRPGRIGALRVCDGQTQNANGFAVHGQGTGAVPFFGIYEAELISATNQAGYALFRSNVGGVGANFGTVARQMSYRSIFAAGVPSGTGGNGAYHIGCDTGGATPFFVTANGNTRLLPSAGPNPGTILALDPNGIVGFAASLAAFKENIVDLPNPAWIHTIRPRRFNFIGHANVPRFGFVVEELTADGAPAEVLSYLPQANEFGDPTGQMDPAAPISVDPMAIIAALVEEVQKLRVDVDSLLP